MIGHFCTPVWWIRCKFECSWTKSICRYRISSTVTCINKSATAWFFRSLKERPIISNWIFNHYRNLLSYLCWKLWISLHFILYWKRIWCIWITTIWTRKSKCFISYHSLCPKTSGWLLKFKSNLVILYKYTTTKINIRIIF